MNDTISNIVTLKPRPATRAAVTRHADTERMLELRLQLEALEFKARKERERRDYWLENRDALFRLGENAPDATGRQIFVHAGCIALIGGMIARDAPTRDEILYAMRHQYRYAYRHAGYLLSQMCGDDPMQHLWFRDEAGRYRLHPAPTRLIDQQAA